MEICGRNFALDEKRRGEMAARRLSEKAEWWYNSTDGNELALYEYGSRSEPSYAITGFECAEQIGMTISEVNAYFCAGVNEFAEDIRSRYPADVNEDDIDEGDLQILKASQLSEEMNT